MMEIWKDIPGYDCYQVSNTGRVRSLERVRNKWDGKRIVKGKELAVAKNLRGYLFVYLHRPGERPKMKTVHRLVAEAFIPNPDNLPQINHKNEVKTDNRVENLEWCTALYNVNYGNRSSRCSRTMSKGVIVLSEDGEVIGDYNSLGEAASAFSRSKSTIFSYINGISKNTNGLTFKYK